MHDRYNISYDYVCQCFREENGKLFWKKRPLEHFVDQRACNTWNSGHAEKEAGGFNFHGRCIIRIDYESYYRHVVIFMLKNGYWPGLVDHKNRNLNNDSISNLREATRSQNGANRSMNINNKSGYKGVCFYKKSGKWTAQICVNQRKIHLGYFDDPRIASEAYMEAARFYFGDFASDGYL